MSAAMITTFNRDVISFDGDKRVREDADGQALANKPFRGIVLGVVLSVPMWVLLALGMRAVI